MLNYFVKNSRRPLTRLLFEFDFFWGAFFFNISGDSEWMQAYLTYDHWPPKDPLGYGVSKTMKTHQIHHFYYILIHKTCPSSSTTLQN